MSSNNLLPTHYQIFINRLTNWLSVISLIIVVIVLLSWWTVTYAVRRNCDDFYKRHTHVSGYWIDLQVGSTDLNCPEYKSTNE